VIPPALVLRIERKTGADMSMAELLLKSLRHRFRGIKKSGDGVIAQVDDADIVWQFNPEANSIAIIVQHLQGNMLSRWTGFLTTDGDKPWRDRDGEFESKQLTKVDDASRQRAPAGAMADAFDREGEVTGVSAERKGLRELPVDPVYTACAMRDQEVDILPEPGRIENFLSNQWPAQHLSI
jgi:hypothetical protein